MQKYENLVDLENLKLNAPTLAIVAVHTAESEPLKIWEVNHFNIHSPPGGGHGHAAVLDLRMAQEADGRFIPLVPEVRLGQVERIPVADNRVELFRQLHLDIPKC